VQLVDDHVAEVFKQLRPSRMVREDAGMHHVRIAEDEVRARSNRPPRVLRRVAVVGEDADLLARRRGERLGHRLQFGELILRERLRRKQVQRPAGRILQDGVENRHVVAQRLARRGRRDDHDVAAGERVPDRFRLMRIELFDPPLLKPPEKARIERLGERRVLRRHCRKAAHGGDVQIRGVRPLQGGTGVQALDTPSSLIKTLEGGFERAVPSPDRGFGTSGGRQGTGSCSNGSGFRLDGTVHAARW
jgi:hypothetical protein